MRTFFAVYLICATALINGLMACAITSARAHDDANLARNLLVVAITFRFLGFLFLIVLFGGGSMKQAAMPVVVLGFAAGCCIAFVSGWCLLTQATLTNDWKAILTHDFFPLDRILEAGLMTGIVFLCLKSIGCLLGALIGHSRLKAN